MNPVQTFLRNNYSDERLAQLLAHCQDGKFSYNSCCCLVGIVNANHPLESKLEDGQFGNGGHYLFALQLEGAKWAEEEIRLIPGDIKRREYLIPLIEAEIQRRADESTGSNSVAVGSGVGDLCGVALSACRHENRNEAMTCIFYRANKTDQVGKCHGPNHFELSQVSA